MIYKAVKDCRKNAGCASVVFCKGVIVDLEPENRLTEQWLIEGSLMPITEKEAKQLGILDEWRKGNE